MSIENETTDELSLLDILDFLRDEARMILATAGAATLLGLAAAFLLPEKFVGSALLEPAKVLGKPIDPHGAQRSEEGRVHAFGLAREQGGQGAAERHLPDRGLQARFQQSRR